MRTRPARSCYRRPPSSSGWVRSAASLGAALGFVAIPAAAATLAQMPGFPVSIGARGGGAALLVVDLDDDRRPEIVAAAGESIAVVDAGGKVRSGFPAALARTADGGAPLGLRVAPVACDLDVDGRPEIIVTGGDGHLYALDGRGQSVAGFPVALGGVARGSPSCMPARRGAKGAVVLATDTGALVTVSAGDVRPRPLAMVGEGAESGIAIGDVDGDGSSELVAVGGDAVLYVLDAAGRRRGAGYRMAFRASGTPALGDIDDDGRFEVVVGSQDYAVHAVRSDGTALSGFPIRTEYRIYAGPTLVDLDGDTVIDVVVGSGDGKLYAVDGRGRSLPGFPVKLDGRITADVVAGDLDRDGRPEIAAVTHAGSLYLVRANGKIVSGTPLRLGGKLDVAPALADLDGDGVPEVVAFADDGRLHAYGLAKRGKAERALVPWPLAGHDAARSGRYGPNDGRFHDVGYGRPEATTTDAIEARYRFVDADGDPETGTQIRWYLDGKRVPELDNARVVPPERTRKHQRWKYTLQEGANFSAFGETGVLSRLVTAPEIVIQNTPATAPEIVLEPAAPLTTARLEAKIVRPSVDVDGDPLAYRYGWLNGGKPQNLPPTQSTIEPTRTRKRETWRVIVVPFDGEVEGAPATATVVIRNTPPGAARVSLSPASPRIDDTTAIVLDEPAPDGDGDPLTYVYRYFLDGKPFALPATSGRIDARVLRKHQHLRIEVTSRDDEAAGGTVSLEVEVRNTPPPAPKVAVWPLRPRTSADLAMILLETAPDADLDKVELRHRWFKDGAPVDFGPTVPASATRKGELWRVEVAPFDGEESGPVVRAETRIENTPPRPPLVVLDRYEPFVDEPVRPRIVLIAEDDDGDPVRLRYAWKLGGKPQKFPEDKSELAPYETKRDQTWEIEVIPFDGEDAGPTTRLAFRVQNSPPAAPSVVLSVARPTIVDKIEARIATPAADKDGDAVTYRYRWYRNGEPLSRWPLTKSALEPAEAKKGEQWRVEVRAYDGAAEGLPTLAEVRIDNQRPPPPHVDIAPATPRAADALQCRVLRAAVDPDGDAVIYRTRWFVDGRLLPSSPERDRSPSGVVKKGQSWQCEMVATDGAAVSDAVRSTAVRIANTPPGAPIVAIAPVGARTGDDLRCEIATPASDPDLDRLTYRFEWRVDGKPVRGEATGGTRVPASATRRGQVWECIVTAQDGESEGASATARLEIGNTAPSAPLVVLVPEHPIAGSALECRVATPADDADGDAVRYEYAWFKDGLPQSFAPTSTEVPGRLVKTGDLWRCAVAASDGTDQGPPAETADAVVEPGGETTSARAR